jgi:hypothetical protein
MKFSENGLTESQYILNDDGKQYLCPTVALIDGNRSSEKKQLLL